MTLIKSISGIRGTIGGKTGDNLTPADIVKFASAYGQWLRNRNKGKKIKVAIGRDARLSGEMVQQIVTGSLLGMGIDVVDMGLSTTPTVEIAVPELQASGGIILTASHNPIQWNALKLLNEKGEFISGKDGEEVLAIAESDEFDFVEVKDLGKVTKDESFLGKHIEKICALPYVDIQAVHRANFTVVVDAVNSSGGIFVTALLQRLGVRHIEKLYCEPTGHFPHNPEPLPENLTEISKVVKEKNAHLGIVVDPDVDRLALVCENGEMFGEEYTLVAVADHVLELKKGNTVSNLSSTRALRDVTEKFGGNYFASAVGEVNVVEMMKANNAVIGGEGNGGVILPELHYGRDALVGIAIFLTHLAKSCLKCSELRATYPDYFISKNKIELTPQINVDDILLKMKSKYASQPVNDIDGVKIEFGNEWVHLRKSNTEPIIRIYSESGAMASADALAQKIIKDIQEIAAI
jgi:phosphomannomutase